MSNAKVLAFTIVYIVFIIFWFWLLPFIIPKDISVENPLNLVYVAILPAWLIIHFALLVVIAFDAKSKKINTLWWVIALFLGWIGGIIYLIINWNKGTKK